MKKLNKIFQIGFNKCGTISFLYFFKEVLGTSKCVHWDNGNLITSLVYNNKNDIPLLDSYEDSIFISDMEGLVYENEVPTWNLGHINFYKKLDQQYPDSKFILNLRRKEDWIKSRLRHVFKIKNLNYSYLEVYKEIYNLSKDEVLELWSSQWDDHISDVLKYFENRPNDLLIYNIQIDSGEKIVNFFKDYIKCKHAIFPHCHPTSDLQEITKFDRISDLNKL